MSKRDAQSTEDIAAFCELIDYFHQPVNLLVRHRARLGLRRHMNRSQVILIDEVLSVGDQGFRVKAGRRKSQFSEDRRR